ncbi:EAL domain-containing protein [Hyphomicrobium sp.]|uniref:EAL domain-containing protein n=1 Tax=Hyphomicrobium sp. TaxID=82 RepID=UPI0025C3E1B9|nr:EAL domain-containing protein [Hyphomicrobium sp.]MCC7250495.1 EAL domain-containing protein [Hyphomicrobium sp.]
MTRLHALLVEDSEDDAILLQEALKHGGYDVSALRVDTGDALRQALRDGQWDVVFADYSLPSSSAKDTLETVRESGLDLPVIVISGTVGEDVAVETLKLGAVDYLLKQNLTRLVPAVQHALDVAENRRQRRQLEHMKTIILENSPDLICSFDGEGRFLEVSSASRDMLGYEPTELKGAHFETIAHPDDLDRIKEEFQAVLRGGQSRNFEKRCIHRSGKVVHLLWSAALSKTDGIVVGVGHDVTERRLKDEALRRIEDDIRRERALLRALIDSIPDLIFFKDRSFQFRGCNRATEKYLGVQESWLIGKNDFDLLPETWAKYYRTEDEKLFASGQAQRTEEQIPAGDGSVRTFDTIKTLFHGPNGELLGLLGVSRDITERKQLEEALREKNALFAAQVESSAAGILVTDPKGNKIIQNRRLNEMWDIPADTASDPTLPPQLEFAASRTTAPSQFVARVTWLFDHPNEIGRDEIELVDGRILDRYSAPVLDADGRCYWRTWIHHDITERREAERRIRYLATHDDLTGLPNRNLIHDLIRQAIAKADQAGHHIALLYLDLDRFKMINDGHGHPFGDAVLKAAAERLSTLVREDDAVARQNGDEFLILLTGLRDATDAHSVAQKIVESIATPLVVQGREIHLSGSIGVSVYPQDGNTADALIGNADVAMYRAKERGRNIYQAFTSSMREEVQSRVDLEARLHAAVTSGQLELAYQPKVSLETGRIIGCEALLRWHDPELGTIPPSRFIPAAEDSGLIVPIGDWALRVACSQARAWLDSGLPPVCIAVNLSVRQFLQQDVLAWVMRTLKETGLPPELLDIELTESLIAHDAEKVTATFSQLRALGVKLSIDDFGTGYSSLSYLKHFRVDTLKIDRSFISNMLAKPEDATIVRAAIALAHNLKCRVVAEGVETEEQCRFLRESSCDEIQGYYFSVPVSADAFEAMVRSGKTLRTGSLASA